MLAFATGGGFVYVVTGSCGDGVCRNLLLRRAALGANSWSSTALPVGLIDPIVELAVHGASVWLSVSSTAGNHPNQVLLASRKDRTSAPLTAHSPSCARTGVIAAQKNMTPVTTRRADVVSW